ncbi:unnamed protein product, partial [Choristocarpus tenellus]
CGAVSDGVGWHHSTCVVLIQLSKAPKLQSLIFVFIVVFLCHGAAGVWYLYFFKPTHVARFYKRKQFPIGWKCMTALSMKCMQSCESWQLNQHVIYLFFDLFIACET